MPKHRIFAAKNLLPAAAIMLSVLTLSNAAEAQTVTPPQQDCTADPNADKPADGNLTSKLGDCKSVLAPPKVGDGEIVTPPPQTGKTPVIKPGDLPPNKNN